MLSLIEGIFQHHKSISEASSFRYNTCAGGELPVELKYTPLDQRLGKKLEELREEKGMTREELADQVGVTPGLSQILCKYRRAMQNRAKII